MGTLLVVAAEGKGSQLLKVLLSDDTCHFYSHFRP